MIERTKYELDLLMKKCDVNDKEGIAMQKSINDNVLEIVEKFCEMGHSGFSAEYEINLIIRALKQLPLTRLTLNDDEFVEISDGVFQNVRDSRIFKQADRFDGKPFNVDTMKEYDIEKGE